MLVFHSSLGFLLRHPPQLLFHSALPNGTPDENTTKTFYKFLFENIYIYIFYKFIASLVFSPCLPQHSCRKRFGVSRKKQNGRRLCMHSNASLYPRRMALPSKSSSPPMPPTPISISSYVHFRHLLHTIPSPNVNLVRNKNACIIFCFFFINFIFLYCGNIVALWEIHRSQQVVLVQYLLYTVVDSGLFDWEYAFWTNFRPVCLNLKGKMYINIMVFINNCFF